MSWPIKCPNCDESYIPYRSDRTGNVRRYHCKECGAVYIATVKGMKSESVMSEPRNLSMEDLHWTRVLTGEV